MKRTPIENRKLPRYTKGEEIMNMVTHIVGGAVGILGLGLCLYRAVGQGTVAVATAMVFGMAMIAVYAVSSIYHGLHPSTGKKVMQILDHCGIYFLIAGTYTPIAVCAFAPRYPLLGWGMVAFQWGMAALAVTLTAIDLHKYKVFSMTCYIGMGWAVLPFLPQTMEVLTNRGFQWLLAGGIAYTFGAILFGIGSKKAWFHSVFHIFTVLGSFLQLIAVAFYVF
jgi:hemolysin III